MTERTVIDTDAPAGYEVPETTDAKDAVYQHLAALLEWYGITDHHEFFHPSQDAIGVADRVVESLIALGWRPTV